MGALFGGGEVCVDDWPLVMLVMVVTGVLAGVIDAELGPLLPHFLPLFPLEDIVPVPRELFVQKLSGRGRTKLCRCRKKLKNTLTIAIY